MDSDQGKLFIGGISWETSEDNLKEYFSNYGDVLQTVVMRDKITGKPRGFAFVSFADPSIIDRVLQDTHTINGRTVEAKRAMSREEQQTSTRTGNSGIPVRVSSGGSGGSMRTKKIFVGGLPATLGEDAFRSYFESYGSVTDVVVMYDQATQRPRGFGFISFDTEDAVDRVLHKTFHDLNGKQVEVKRALPKDSSPSGGNTGRSSAGGSGGNYQGYGGNSSGNSGGYDARNDSSRYMQPQNTSGGFPSYGSTGYNPSGFGYGPANNGMGYGGYGGYGGGNPGYGGPNSAAAYGNPNVPVGGGGYPGGPQGVPRNSWTSQAQSAYGTLGYGNAGGYGSGNAGSVQTAQSPSGGAGYGNQAYGYGGSGGGGGGGGYGGGGDSSGYANQSGYGVVGGRGGGSVQEANVPGGGMGELQGSGGYMAGGGGGGYGNNNANGGSGYVGNAGWRSETLQGSGNYGASGAQGGYGGGYGGGGGGGAAQGRQ